MDSDKGQQSYTKPDSSVDASLGTVSTEVEDSSRDTTTNFSGKDSNHAAQDTQYPRRAASIAASEAGSVTSDLSSGAYSADIREQELAIERQRMRERELQGGETGMGGTVPPPFARLPDNLMQLRASHSQRSMSSAATVASSPATSLREGEPDYFVSSSRPSPVPSLAGEELRPALS